ncbi:MAG: Bestrophin, RFP-TM, chloride channel-domain-containing protein [Monoraphidium minutum]|nr:MAG: Bestrophin, RFP-TM, chloride channel-domain-containing protein [Monoraphidium minutum]
MKAVQQKQQLGRATAGPRLGAAPRLALRAAAPARRALAVRAIGTYDDEVKEQSRKYRRTVFSVDNWETHRSVDRYARHIQSMFTSRVVWGLSRPLTYVAGVSSFVVAYETLRINGVLPEGLPSIQLTSKEPFGLTSFALSLLLVFRTNSSYGRWDEARKMWGLVLNRSRDVVRQGLSYIPEDKPELREMLVRWTPAFSRALMCHLRKGEDLRDEVKDILLPHEIDSLMMATHRPNYCLQVLAQIIKSSDAGTAATIRMDDNLTAFEDCLGGCERILKTPIPLSYTRHTSRFLIIWLTLLPFSLYGSLGFGTIPLALVISFLLLGIEEIGVSVEEPFSILALEAICESATNNTRELQNQHGLASGFDKDGKATGQLSAAQLVTMSAGGEAKAPARAGAGAGAGAANGAARASFATVSFRN